MVSIPTLPTERPTPATELDAETDYITAENSQQLRQLRAAYFASVSYVDYQIGRLLVGLRQAGTRDDTLVVVLSDQGFSLGEGGRMSSGTPTESALHVPMLVRFPNRIEENVVVNRFGDTTAIAPTLLEMAGLEIPKGMESQSLAPELREPSSELDGAAFSELGFQTIRTPGWRLTDPKDHKTWVPQLFDLSSDPTESENLFGKAEHAKVQSDLDVRLKKWASTKPAKVRV
jgi:arylsulfatase A-like enzyme